MNDNGCKRAAHTGLHALTGFSFFRTKPLLFTFALYKNIRFHYTHRYERVFGQKYSGVAAAFWIVIALLILIAFLVKWDHLVSVLKETAFFEHVFGKEPEFISRFEPAEQTELKPDETAPPKTETKPAEPPPLPKAREETVRTPQAGAEDSVKPKEQKQSEKSVPETKPAPAAAKMNQYLCFIVINGDRA